MQSTVQNHLGRDNHERFTNLVFLNLWLGFLVLRQLNYWPQDQPQKMEKNMQIVTKRMHLRIRAFRLLCVKNQENKITISILHSFERQLILTWI